jgi:hypothetical protein
MGSVASTEVSERQPHYVLAPDARVRVERFGLLFYCRSGPRLYALSCGTWITPDFFTSGQTLKEWLGGIAVPEGAFQALEKTLAGLVAKGVLRACK